jgi:hypothetical protein
MKIIITLFFGLMISGLLYSQEYYPIVQENNEWDVLKVNESGPYPWDTIYWTETFILSGDTVLNEQNYKKMYKSAEEFPLNWSYWGGLREENQKVWHIGINNYRERLIYDFDLSVGDTIWLYEFDPMIVDSIQYKPINGENRKHIYFSYSEYPSLTELWIEGIGSNRGILEPGPANFDGGGFWLLCMKENGDLIYMNPNYDNCFLITDIEEINNSLFQVYPNPAQDKIKITNTENIRIESISFVDLKGQKLREFENNKTEFDLSGISTGIYLLKLTHENGEIIRKIIIE